MKRNRASKEYDVEINENKKASRSTPEKMKADDRNAIANLMRIAITWNEVSSYEASVLYEQAGNLADCLEDQVGARRAFLELGDAYLSLAKPGIERMDFYKTALTSFRRLGFYKKALTSFGKAVSSSKNLLPGPTARSVQDSVFKAIAQVIDFVKTIDSEQTRNIWLEQAVRSLKMSGEHWLEVVCMAKFRLAQAEMLEEDIWAKEKEPLLQDKEVRRSLKLIEVMEIDYVEEFAKFLFEFFEPDHLKEQVTFEAFKKEATTEGFINDQKKMLMKLIIHWHPDKVSKETEEEKKWCIICEEITKKLTAKYTLMKG